MKKLIVLFASMLVGFSSIGQEQNEVENLKAPYSIQKSQGDGWRINAPSSNLERPPITNSNNYLRALLASGQGNFGPNPRGLRTTHADTPQILNSSGELVTISWRSAGMGFDPKAQVWDFVDGMTRLYEWHSYDLDSVSFPYNYNRAVDSITNYDTTFNDTTYYSFRVNGKALDTLPYKEDTTWKFTNTDTSALPALTVDFYGNLNTIDSTKEYWPPYNVYDTANNNDTNALAPDDTLINIGQTVTLVENVDAIKKQVVDTLYYKYYVEGSGLLPSIAPGQQDTTFFITARYNESRGLGNNAVSTGEILLTSEDVTDADDGQGVISEAINERVPQGLSVGITLTFKPGYEVTGNDTLFVLGENEITTFKHNTFRLTTGTEVDGRTPERGTYNQAFARHTLQYGSDFDLQYFDNKYYPMTGDFLQRGGNPVTEMIDVFFTITANGVSIEEKDSQNSVIKSIYPNPVMANKQSTINFSLEEASQVNVSIYNSLGQQVGQMMNGFYRSGDHEAALELGDLEPGIYFLQVKTSDQTQTQKINIVK